MKKHKSSAKDKFGRPVFKSLPTRKSHMKEAVQKSLDEFGTSAERPEFGWKSAVSAVTVLGVIGAVGAAGAYVIRKAGGKSKSGAGRASDSRATAQLGLYKRKPSSQSRAKRVPQQ